MHRDEQTFSGVVQRWFGNGFLALDPALQRLHINGGVLDGPVEIKIATGFAGLLACRLARRLGIPLDSLNPTLCVEIHEDSGKLHWIRTFNTFNGSNRLISVFEPIGAWPTGYWIESTGSFRLALRVEVKDSSWHWLPIKAWLNEIRVPLFLLTKTTAYKRIELGQYRFYVGFSLPLLGTFLSYAGILVPSSTTNLFCQ